MLLCRCVLGIEGVDLAQPLATSTLGIIDFNVCRCGVIIELEITCSRALHRISLSLQARRLLLSLPHLNTLTPISILNKDRRLDRASDISGS